MSLIKKYDITSTISSLPAEVEEVGVYRQLKDLTPINPIYSTSNPSIEFTETLSMEELISFQEVVDVTGLDVVKYILAVDTVDKYHDGASWVDSNGTYLQSNTASEIDINKASLLSTASVLVVKAFFHSELGSTTPKLQEVNIEYDFASVAEEIHTTIVYGFNKNSDGTANISTFTATLSVDVNDYANKTQVRNNTVTITPRADGYWEVELADTDGLESGSYYVFNWGDVVENRYIPNIDAVAYKDLPKGVF